LTKLERHRFFLYGRIGLSLVLYLAAMILGVTEMLTAASGAIVWVLGGLLIGSVVVLPRSPVPRDEETRREATDEELEHFKRVRTWLTWARLAYLAVAIGVLIGLPRLL